MVPLRLFPRDLSHAWLLAQPGGEGAALHGRRYMQGKSHDARAAARRLRHPLDFMDAHASLCEFFEYPRQNLVLTRDSEQKIVMGPDPAVFRDSHPRIHHPDDQA